jgi:hypothetical protein
MEFNPNSVALIFFLGIREFISWELRVCLPPLLTLKVGLVTPFLEDTETVLLLELLFLLQKQQMHVIRKKKTKATIPGTTKYVQ